MADPTWPELLGSDHWSGLLEPLHPLLRVLVLRCGDLCQVTYDSFVSDTNSKFCGSSRFGKSSLLDKVGFEPASAGEYSVAAFLYATATVSLPEALLLHSQSRDSWDRETNWIGYVAVRSSSGSSGSNKRREIYIALRGTTRNYEWIDLLGAELQSAKPLLNPDLRSDGPESSSSSDEDQDGGPKVMRGWLSIYTSSDPRSKFARSSMRAQISAAIAELREKYKSEELSVIFTGHSLGASLSVLAAFDLVENGVTDIPVSAIVFGSPKIGNKEFNDRLTKFPNLRVLHVRNTIDLITHYPGRVLGYVKSGTELVIDTRKSPSLKDSKNPSDWHNLQAMLHIVAGWNGEKGEFKLMVKRSVALVNKSCEYLKDELLVPGSWWVEKNKGMVLNDDGEWGLAPPDDEDDF